MIVLIAITGTYLGMFLTAWITDLRTDESKFTDKDWKLINKTI